MAKHYTIIISCLAVVLFLVNATTVLAALELDYPTLPFVTWNMCAGGPCPSLPQLISYFFIFAIVAVGIIAVLSIAISGVQILLSAGSPTAITAAREKVLSAALGIVLLFLSVVLLRTINPNLVGLQQTGVSLMSGQLYLSGDINCNGDLSCISQWPDGHIYRPITTQVSNTNDATQMDQLITKIYYYCGVGAPNNPQLVWLYNMTNFIIDINANGTPNVTTRTLNCGEEIALGNSGSRNVLSFKITREEPGVYFYIKDDCQGISSERQVESDWTPSFAATTSDGSDYYPYSIRIVSGQDSYQRYGIVLKESTDGLVGECSEPIINTNPGSICISSSSSTPFPETLEGDGFYAEYAYIFRHFSNYPNTSNVTLYSDNLFVRLPKYLIGNHFIFPTPFNPPGGRVDNLLRLPSGGGQGQKTRADSEPRDGECSADDPVAQDRGTCLASTTNQGAFITVLYAKNNLTDSKNCVFLYRGFNYVGSDGRDLFSNGEETYRIDIMPTVN